VKALSEELSFTTEWNQDDRQISISQSVHKLNTEENLSYSAIPAYNHAYQENYMTDTLDLILEEAENAYVLLDPNEPSVLEALPSLKEKENEVSAYISIGTGENWRDDFNELEPYLVAKQWGDWNGEFFVNDVTTGILPLMKKRLDLLAEQGFEWVEFDNMDWAFDDVTRERYNFKVTHEEAIDYYQKLCGYAHSIGLKCMAKNTTIGSSSFDGVTYESYASDKNWWDNTELQTFLDQGKLGLIVHYNDNSPEKTYNDYLEIYGEHLSFISESISSKSYVHFNTTNP